MHSIALKLIILNPLEDQKQINNCIQTPPLFSSTAEKVPEKANNVILQSVPVQLQEARLLFYAAGELLLWRCLAVAASQLALALPRKRRLAVTLAHGTSCLAACCPAAGYCM